MPWRAITCGAAFTVLTLSAPAAVAELCKYVDANGNVTYSDSTVKGATKSNCFEAPPVPPTPPKAPNTATPAAGSATGLPNVDPGTQRKRDDARRKILQDELATEEKSLEEARKALAEGEAIRLGSERNYQRYLDRIQGLKDRVTQHERNVNALKQELSNLR
jgi:hypothetical protein